MFCHALKKTFVHIFLLLVSLYFSLCPMEAKKPNQIGKGKPSTEQFNKLFGPCDYHKIFHGQIKPSEIEKFSQRLVDRAIMMFCSGHLHLFDPVASNDQCHISAIRAVELFRLLKAEIFRIDHHQPLSQPEVRYLVLSFLLTSCFSTDHDVMKVMMRDEKHPKVANKFKDFCGNKDLRDLAKRQVAQLTLEITRKYIGDIKKLQRGSPPTDGSKPDLTDTEELLLDELKQLSLRDDLILEDDGIARFPKFPGALVFLEKTRQAMIPIVLNAKIICNKGVHRHTLVYGGDEVLVVPEDTFALPDIPCVVIEGVSCPETLGDEKVTFEMFKALREHCPHGLFSKKPGARIGYTGYVHDLKNACALCRPCPDNKTCEVFLAKAKRLAAFTQLSSLLLPNAADFTKTRQHEYVKKFLSADGSFKELQKTFAAQMSASKGLNSEDPSVFAIEHVHPDLLENALKRRFLDTRAEVIVQEDQL